MHALLFVFRRTLRWHAFKARVPPTDLLGISAPFCAHNVHQNWNKRLREETRIVKMVLSNMSISISSPFSSDLISTTNFRYIKAPRLEVSAETKAEDGKKRKMQVSSRDAVQATGNTWSIAARLHRSRRLVLCPLLGFCCWPIPPHRAEILISCTCAFPFNEQEEDSAFGTYAGAGGKRLVYRERTPAGNYRIIERTVDEAMSREEMLDMRATKKADRHCN